MSQATTAVAVEVRRAEPGDGEGGFHGHADRGLAVDQRAVAVEDGDWGHGQEILPCRGRWQPCKG